MGTHQHSQPSPGTYGPTGSASGHRIPLLSFGGGVIRVETRYRAALYLRKLLCKHQKPSLVTEFQKGFIERVLNSLKNKSLRRLANQATTQRETNSGYHPTPEPSGEDLIAAPAECPALVGPASARPQMP